MRLKEPGDDPNDFGRVKHSGFRRRRGKSFKESFQLPAHNFRPAGLDCQNAFRILCRDARDGAGPVHAQRGERFQVRLDARAAAAVRAGDSERNGNGFKLRHANSMSDYEECRRKNEE